MKVILIRHFQTEGNKKKRYIGVTDEPLCEEEQNRDVTGYGEVERVIVSPMKRCLQTAKLIYKEFTMEVCEDLRECDFGRFENKNYKELAGDPLYQQWIDSNGAMPFPEGESMEQFKGRTLKAYKECILEARVDGVDALAFVVHGGTIMTIAEELSGVPGSYYDWHVQNGESVLIEYEGENIRSIKKQT